MGTNYYARILPTQEELDNLINLIHSKKYESIRREANRLFGEQEYNSNCGRFIHLGKRSCGWKFLWNANVRFKYEGPSTLKAEYVYPLTKKGLLQFLSQPNIRIESEYYSEEGENDSDDCPTAKEFLDMAFNWCLDGYDYEKYRKEYPDEYTYYNSEGYRFAQRLGFETCNGEEFYSDGLRFSTSRWFS